MLARNIITRGMGSPAATTGVPIAQPMKVTTIIEYLKTDGSTGSFTFNDSLTVGPPKETP